MRVSFDQQMGTYLGQPPAKKVENIITMNAICIANKYRLKTKINTMLHVLYVYIFEVFRMWNYI